MSNDRTEILLKIRNLETQVDESGVLKDINKMMMEFNYRFINAYTDNFQPNKIFADCDCDTKMTSLLGDSSFECDCCGAIHKYNEIMK